MIGKCPRCKRVITLLENEVRPRPSDQEYDECKYCHLKVFWNVPRFKFSLFRAFSLTFIFLITFDRFFSIEVDFSIFFIISIFVLCLNFYAAPVEFKNKQNTEKRSKKRE